MIFLLLLIFAQVKERLKHYARDASACDLLDKLLILDPSKRVDADTALNHDFFWLDPLPTDLSKMLAQHNQSMFEYLAPPRRPNPMRAHHMQVNSSASKTLMDTGYQDRVF